jgi:hypothetical protein
MSHTPNPRPGISEATQHSDSSVQPAKDTPLCDSGRDATTWITLGVGDWTIGCGDIAADEAGDKIVEIGCQSLLPSTQARSVSFKFPFDEFSEG